LGSRAGCGVEDAGDPVAKLLGAAVTGGMLPEEGDIEGEEEDDDMPAPLR
jgi:hypothetical protein